MSKPIQVVAVTGGKGGVGKTNVSVNLSMALAGMGRRVALLDADLGLANVDILLGIKARYTLEDVLRGERELIDILVRGPGGIHIVPASSGVQKMAELGVQEHAGLIHAFSELAPQLDVLVVDTAAGISDLVISFVRAVQEVILVVCDEPTSITDAYALLKVLNQQYGMQRFRVLANMTRSDQEGRALFAKLTRVADRFLDVGLQYIGCIPFDENLRKAVQRQKPVLEAYPQTQASAAFRRLAEQVDRWPLPAGPRGHLEFFVERLIGGGVEAPG